MPQFNAIRLRFALGFKNTLQLRQYMVECGIWVDEFATASHHDLVRYIVDLTCAAYDSAQAQYDMEEHAQE